MPFPSLLESLKGKEVLLLTHRGADVDAVSASGMLYFALRNSNACIGVPEHINQSAEKLASELSIPFELNPEPKEFNSVIVLDLNSWKMLGSTAEKLKSFSGEIFLIDHHSPSDDCIASKENTLIEEKAASTTEILFKLFKEQGIPISKEMAILAAAGIITDSAHFSYASRDTFIIMAEALEIAGISYNKIVGLFFVERDLSETIARLKAAKRCRIFRIGSFVIATSDIGAFEAQAASSFLRLGADVAFVGAAEAGEVMVSGRASQRVLEFGLDLVEDVFEPLSARFCGEGGGHTAAAAFNGKADSLDEVLQECVSLVAEKIRKKSNEKVQLREYK